MSQLFTLGRVRLVAPDGVIPVAAQPKRLALLAYVALASARGAVRRDALLALFWPELGDEEGRRALRQGLHYLRRTLGLDVLVGEGDELRIREGALGCDAVDFERLLDDGRVEEALALYGGDFLDGFHVDDVASEYEEWVDRTRARLRRRAATAAWSAAEAAERAGEGTRTVELARRGCELEPDQEGGWRRLMALHERAGDRAGALRAYEELVARLAREFDAIPAPETTALAESIRRSTREAAPSPPRLEHAASIEAPTSAAPLSEAPASAASPTGGPAFEFDSSLPLVAPTVTAAEHSLGEPASAAITGRSRSPRTRRLAVVGVAAAALLAVGATAYLSTRETDAEPSLLATGALARKDRVLVADVANLAGDSSLAAALTEVLRVDLSQSPFVTVLTPRQVRTTLTKMERAPDVAVDDSVAREVALRMGVKAFVTGSVANVAGSYSVTAQLVGAQKGEVLAAYREIAPDSSAIIAAVDRVSKRLRHRIGESLRSLRDLPSLTDETTASLAALRHYAEANQLALAGERGRAVEHYRQAVAIDSTFAGAWSALAMTYGAVGNEGRAHEAAMRAFHFKDHLPFTDRSFLVASYAYGRGDYDTAIEEYRRLIERYPDNFKAINNLALIYQDRRQFAVAESLFTRATEIDSTVANLYFGIEGNQLLQGKFADARRTLDLVARRFPGNDVRLVVEVQLASAQQRWEEAERRAEAVIAANAHDTLALVDPFEALAQMASAQGRLDDAEKLWRAHQHVATASGEMGRRLFGVVRRAGIELRYRNRPARALAIVDSVFARTPLDSLLPGDRPYDELARFNAIAGRLDHARQLAAAADTNDKRLDRQQLAEREWTRGVIELAEGHAASAERRLRFAAQEHVCTICVLPDLGRAYEAAGKGSAAAEVYERYASTPWFWRYETDALELGPALERLAAIYEVAGERGKAASTRARLVQLWRRADAELQPAVARARGAMDRGER